MFGIQNSSDVEATLITYHRGGKGCRGEYMGGVVAVPHIIMVGGSALPPPPFEIARFTPEAAKIEINLNGFLTTGLGVIIHWRLGS